MSLLRHQLLPWIKVLVCQALALGGVVLLADRMQPGTFPVLLGQGLAAAALGHVLGLSRVWLPLQVLLPLALAYGDAVPAWAYLAAFLLCALVYWNSASEQVPLYLTNWRTWQALSDLVSETGARHVVDLGSGMGGVVTFLARAHPQVQARGLETAPLVYAASRLRVGASRLPNARIIYRSLWDDDLSAYDLVYCFLVTSHLPQILMNSRLRWRMEDRCTFGTPSPWESPGLRPPFHRTRTVARAACTSKARFGKDGTRWT